MKGKLFFIARIVLVIAIIAIFFGAYYIDNRIYKISYRQEITKYSTVYDTPASIVASIIKAESDFYASAKSAKGAMGLMQLMPSTAKFVCDKLSVSYSEDRLLEPEFNIMLGTFYFKYLYNKFNNTKTALVAYNAGEGNTSIWLKDKNYSDNGTVIDTTPFKETNNYVAKVLKFNTIYSLKI